MLPFRSDANDFDEDPLGRGRGLARTASDVPQASRDRRAIPDKHERNANRPTERFKHPDVREMLAREVSALPDFSAKFRKPSNREVEWTGSVRGYSGAPNAFGEDNVICRSSKRVSATRQLSPLAPSDAGGQVKRAEEVPKGILEAKIASGGRAVALQGTLPNSGKAPGSFTFDAAAPDPDASIPAQNPTTTPIPAPRSLSPPLPLLNSFPNSSEATSIGQANEPIPGGGHERLMVIIPTSSEKKGPGSFTFPSSPICPRSPPPTLPSPAASPGSPHHKSNSQTLLFDPPLLNVNTHRKVWDSDSIPAPYRLSLPSGGTVSGQVSFSLVRMDSGEPVHIEEAILSFAPSDDIPTASVISPAMSPHRSPIPSPPGTPRRSLTTGSPRSPQDPPKLERRVSFSELMEVVTFRAPPPKTQPRKTISLPAGAYEDSVSSPRSEIQQESPTSSSPRTATKGWRRENSAGELGSGRQWKGELTLRGGGRQGPPISLPAGLRRGSSGEIVFVGGDHEKRGPDGKLTRSGRSIPKINGDAIGISEGMSRMAKMLSSMPHLANDPDYIQPLSPSRGTSPRQSGKLSRPGTAGRSASRYRDDLSGEHSDGSGSQSSSSLESPAAVNTERSPQISVCPWSPKVGELLEAQVTLSTS